MIRRWTANPFLALNHINEAEAGITIIMTGIIKDRSLFPSTQV
jgi:hypothetical protein